MKKNSPSSSDLADQLVAQAERYAQEALRLPPRHRLELGMEAPDEVLVQMRLRLRTRYLFPQLSDCQHGVLVALYWERQTLTRLVNVSGEIVPASLQAQVERVTGCVEQSFMSLVHHIKDLVRYESFPRSNASSSRRSMCVSRSWKLPGDATRAAVTESRRMTKYEHPS